MTVRRILVRSVVVAVIATVALVGTATPAAADIPGEGIVREVVGDAVGWSFDKVADGVARWVLGAVAHFVDGVVSFLQTSTGPDVEAVWFAGPGSPYATVRNLAAVLLVGFVMLGLLQGLVHGDPLAMATRVMTRLPAAVVGMVVTTAVVGQLLALTDAASSAVLVTTDRQALHFLSGFGVRVTGMTGGFGAVLLGLGAVLAALILWVELLVRGALVYLLVALSPLGFAAMLWPAARGLVRRMAEVLLAVIVSKFVIAVALAIGVAALAGAGDVAGAGSGPAGSTTEGLGTLLVGAVIVGLAAFAPFLVLRLIPFAETAMVAQGISRAPVRAVEHGLGTYGTVNRLTGGPGRSARSSHTNAAPPPPGAAPGPAGPSSAGPAGPASPGASSAGSIVGAAATAAMRQAAKAAKESAEAAGDAPARGPGRPTPPRRLRFAKRDEPPGHER